MRRLAWRFLGAAVVFLVCGTAALADNAPAATGPLGESRADIAARYGPVLRHNARVRHHQILEGGSALDGDLYQKNGIIVRVVFLADHAALLEYTKGAGALTIDDANSLLALSAAGFTWDLGKDSTDTNRSYRRSDNRAIAQWTADFDGSLLIASEDAGALWEKLLK